MYQKRTAKRVQKLPPREEQSKREEPLLELLDVHSLTKKQPAKQPSKVRANIAHDLFGDDLIDTISNGLVGGNLTTKELSKDLTEDQISKITTLVDDRIEEYLSREVHPKINMILQKLQEIEEWNSIPSKDILEL